MIKNELGNKSESGEFRFNESLLRPPCRYAGWSEFQSRHFNRNEVERIAEAFGPPRQQ